MRIELGDGLRTGRLSMRTWRADDGDALLRLIGHPEVNRFLYSAPRTPHDLDGALRRRLARTTLTEVGDVVYLAVERRDDGIVAGEVLLVLRSAEHRGAEFGAVFHPAHHGQGLAAEAGTALLAEGFRQGLHRVYARSDARNTASIALMQRLGMRREAYFVQSEFVKGTWTDEVRCAVLAAEHRSRDTADAPYSGGR